MKHQGWCAIANLRAQRCFQYCAPQPQDQNGEEGGERNCSRGLAKYRRWGDPAMHHKLLIGFENPGLHSLWIRGGGLPPLYESKKQVGGKTHVHLEQFWRWMLAMYLISIWINHPNTVCLCKPPVRQTCKVSNRKRFGYSYIQRWFVFLKIMWYLIYVYNVMWCTAM